MKGGAMKYLIFFNRVKNELGDKKVQEFCGQLRNKDKKIIEKILVRLKNNDIENCKIVFKIIAQETIYCDVQKILVIKKIIKNIVELFVWTNQVKKKLVSLKM